MSWVVRAHIECVAACSGTTWSRVLAQKSEQVVWSISWHRRSNKYTLHLLARARLLCYLVRTKAVSVIDLNTAIRDVLRRLTLTRSTKIAHGGCNIPLACDTFIVWSHTPSNMLYRRTVTPSLASRGPRRERTNVVYVSC
jgi:hypothetical protein